MALSYYLEISDVERKAILAYEDHASNTRSNFLWHAEAKRHYIQPPIKDKVPLFFVNPKPFTEYLRSFLLAKIFCSEFDWSDCFFAILFWVLKSFEFRKQIKCIYQPICTRRLRHKVNFLREV